MAMAAAAPLLGAMPAAAQWFGEEPMPPQAIARIAARHGFTGFAPPRLAGDVYIVNAVTADGARVRLVIDAFNGRILRPLGAAQELTPPRSVGRLRPWDYTPDEDFEDEPRRPERFRGPRDSEDLLPPRPIGRPPAFGERASRERDIDADREYIEPYRLPGAERPLRSEPPLRMEPSPERRSARVGEPAREPNLVAPARPRGPNRAGSPPAATPAPAVEAPEPQPEAKPAATAAVPTPAVQPSDPPAPAAPASAPPGPAPGASGSDSQAKPQPAAPRAPPAAAAPAATASTSPPSKVRVIEGVTPVLPQSTAPADKGSMSEPSTLAQ